MQYLLPALFVVFTTLKLTNYIDWSWWWVCAPLYPAFAIWTFLLCLFAAAFLADHNRAKQRRW